MRSLGVLGAPEGPVLHEEQQCSRAGQGADAQVGHRQGRHVGRGVEACSKEGEVGWACVVLQKCRPGSRMYKRTGLPYDAS